MLAGGSRSAPSPAASPGRRASAVAPLTHRHELPVRPRSPFALGVLHIQRPRHGDHGARGSPPGSARRSPSRGPSAAARGRGERLPTPHGTRTPAARASSCSATPSGPGARVAVHRLLVDRQRRGDPVDEVDRRPLELAYELAGVGGERLHEPPLPFHEDGVVGQGRLAGAGDPGEHDEAVAGHVDVDALQVVGPGVPNADVGGLRHGVGR
jgi:hypothetical protein